MGHPIVFILLAFIAISAAIGMLLSHNAVHSALFLVLNFTSVGVLYLVLNAPFIAMVQITVYAGAIMVLFLFVIMLLGAERLEGTRSVSAGVWQRPLALALGIMLLGTFLFGVVFGGGVSAETTLPAFDASPQALGLALFQNYIFPFELTAILLLVAMIAVVVWRAQSRKK